VKQLWITVLLTFSLYAEGIILPDHFRAAFIQKITNPKGKVITYKGEIRFSSPSLMKWDYSSPSRKEVCTEGKELTVVDHDLEQVTYYFVEKGLNLEAILKKAEVYKKHIYLARYLERTYTIQTDKKNRLQSVAYYDDLDNKVQIIFINIKYGKGALPYRTMRCSIPKAYDRIGR